MRTEPIRTIEGWVKLLGSVGGGLNSLNAATVGSMKGLVASPLPDADIVAELRNLAAAYDRLMER